jgi:hypothetical protein
MLDFVFFASQVLPLLSALPEAGCLYPTNSIYLIADKMSSRKPLLTRPGLRGWGPTSFFTREPLLRVNSKKYGAEGGGGGPLSSIVCKD